MKQIITLILVVLVMSGCTPKGGIINEKSYTNWYGGKMPEGICVYHYNNNWDKTEDSCNKYNVGDTIKH